MIKHFIINMEHSKRLIAYQLIMYLAETNSISASDNT